MKPIPEGFHTITPMLIVKEAGRLIDFLKEALGATELMRFPAPDGSVMHAELKIGDSILMLGETMEKSPAVPASLYVYVEDVDSTYRAAIKAGGESQEGPTDQFWGDRVASIRDFAGNRWMIATHIEDVDSKELERRAQQAMAA